MQWTWQATRGDGFVWRFSIILQHNIPFHDIHSNIGSIYHPITKQNLYKQLTYPFDL